MFQLVLGQIALEVPFNRVQGTLPVVRMKKAFPLVKVVPDLMLLVSQHALPAMGEVYAVGADVPVPDPRIRSSHRQRKALFALPQRVFRLPAIGDVADHARHVGSLPGFQRSKADFDRKLAAVLVETDESRPGAHGPMPRGGNIRGALVRVPLLEPLGDKGRHGSPQQFRPLMPESPLGLGVQEHDPAVRIHDDDGIGEILHESAGKTPGYLAAP